MKNTFIIFAIFLFFSLNCFSQVNEKIDESWKDVKGNLQVKTEIVLKLTAILRNSNKINNAELNQINSNAKDLKIECRKEVLNGQAVKDLKLKSDNLNKYLVRTLVNIELDSKLKSNKNIITIMDELSLAENNIYSKIRKYNEICSSLNKKELIYIFRSESKSPQVEF
ncbi:hypothetical protein BD847_2390 [Flavobacterium cutihirudinis]|uniref:Uncharacterized protein n=1 Tax=Flavobacterium cutihirudinis TaxID=1265740 RepID=A0A3D9FSB8_9FLAO|nr:LemA family protein [Flavobacterium cutihirudinis]RED23340.1 hypothetical protein BD847_2390 [Flavobacterium cutihirudinis]